MSWGLIAQIKELREALQEIADSRVPYEDYDCRNSLERIIRIAQRTLDTSPKS